MEQQAVFWIISDQLLAGSFAFALVLCRQQLLDVGRGRVFELIGSSALKYPSVAGTSLTAGIASRAELGQCRDQAVDWPSPRRKRP